jgi:hypothetical protein
MKDIELCHCGKPLHYTSKELEDLIIKIIQNKGRRWTPTTSLETGKTYKVDIHYIALHGIEADKLHTYGFEEIK